MHNLFRSYPLVEGYPLTSFCELSGIEKEPLPGVQSPATQGTDIAPSSPPSSFSQISLIDYSELENSSLQASPLRHRLTSRTRPRDQALMSNSRRRAQTFTATNDKPVSRKTSTLSDESSTGGRANSVWSTDDAYLPRAKPPPPLKKIRHQRNRSTSSISTLGSTIPSKSSTFCHSSPRQSSTMHSDMPVLDISSKSSSMHDTDVQHTLTRTSSRTTAASGLSEVSEIRFAPPESMHGWKPPTNWAGPPDSKPLNEDDGPKTTENDKLTNPKSAESGANHGSIHVFARLARGRSLKKLRALRSADTVEKEGEGSSRDGRAAPGVLKVKCYEGSSWHEKRMADIIPILRDLRSK